MSENADIGVGAVEVGEDERHALGREGGAEAAAGLVGAVLQVEEAALRHQPVEPAQPRIHGVEHGLRLRHQEVVIARGTRITRRVDQGLVPEAQPLPAMFGLARRHQLAHQRHHVFRHPVAVPRDIIRVIVDPAHVAVGQRRVAVEPQGAGHAVPQMHELVVQVIQFLAVRREERPACLFGSVPDATVGMLRIRSQPREVHRLPVDPDRGAGEQFGVTGAKPGLLLQRGGDRRVKGGDIRLPQSQRVVPGDRSGARHRQQAALHGRLMLRDDGRQTVGILARRLGFRICRVLCKSEMHQRAPAIDRPPEPVPGRQRLLQPRARIELAMQSRVGIGKALAGGSRSRDFGEADGSLGVGHDAMPRWRRAQVKRCAPPLASVLD